MNNPVEAYDLIAFYIDLSIKDEVVRKHFAKIRELIAMKGVFYEAMFVEYGMIKEYEALAKSMNKVIKSMNDTETFVLIYIPIRHEIERRSKSTKFTCATLKKPGMNIIDNYPELFVERFRSEIMLHEKLMNIDETIISSFKCLYPKYLLIP